MSYAYPREIFFLHIQHLAGLKCCVWDILEVVILTLCTPNFSQEHSSALTGLVLPLPGVIFSQMTCGLVSSLFLSVKKEIRSLGIHCISPQYSRLCVPRSCLIHPRGSEICVAFPATKNDHPGASCFSKPTRRLYGVLEIWARKCQLAQSSGVFSKSNLFFYTIFTAMCLPSVLYSLASCFTGKKKFNRTHSLMDWTSFIFILLMKLQMKIWGNNGETCPRCQTMEQNELLRSSCEIPQWISS